MPRFFFQFHPVARRGALIFSRGDGAGELHRAAVKQQLFRQRGLARVGMRNDGERAPPLDFLRDGHKRVAEDSREIRADKLDAHQKGSVARRPRGWRRERKFLLPRLLHLLRDLRATLLKSSDFNRACRAAQTSHNVRRSKLRA